MDCANYPLPFIAKCAGIAKRIRPTIRTLGISVNSNLVGNMQGPINLPTSLSFLYTSLLFIIESAHGKVFIIGVL